MKRVPTDWMALGTSLVLHSVLLLGFYSCELDQNEPTTIGYMEVDFGEFSEGRPVRQVTQTTPQEEPAPEPEPPEPEPEEAPAAPPDEARPVDLPDQDVLDEEVVETPQTETVAPEPPRTRQEEEAEEPEPEPEEVRPLGGAPPEGETGAETGTDGEAADERRAAPFDIEGLNRTPVRTTLPAYTEKVNATIRVRVTVDPQGRIVGRVPLIKANPSLEQAVMDALQRWRFNPLPLNAPQENQTGIITFRFRLQ
ncbi:MAG: TonB family protein [Bacteroidota bacterium]